MDKALLELGLARSRTHAQRLIKEGAVRLGEKAIVAVSELVPWPLEPAEFQILDTPENRYVSRGGLKLEAALDFVRAHFHLGSISEWAPHPLVALDIGISTGGFTDCLLQSGVSHVWGVDVGHAQLDPSLAADPRVTHFEGINARDLSAALSARLNLDAAAAVEDRAADTAARSAQTSDPPLFDLVTIDVSFISLRLILPSAWPLLRGGGLLIALVKPQFELGASALDKRGVVKDPNLYQNLELTMRDWASQTSAEFVHWMSSPITGGDGNHEFLMIVKKFAP